MMLYAFMVDEMIFYCKYMGYTINFDQAADMFCADVNGRTVYGPSAHDVQMHIDRARDEIRSPQ